MPCTAGRGAHTKPPKGFSVQHHVHQPWYMSMAGVLFFMTMLVLFAYVVAVLNVVGDILRRGENMSAAEFRQVYQTDRDSLQNLQQLFTIMLVIMSLILGVMVWSILSQRVKCALFNQYTMVAFFVLVLMVSSWSESSIARRSYVKPSMSVLNGMSITFASIFLVVYAIYALNYHLEFVKLS